ncbi:uncharacterized protein ACJ7VT_008845 [Polymixia lowei]
MNPYRNTESLNISVSPHEGAASGSPDALLGPPHHITPTLNPNPDPPSLLLNPLFHPVIYTGNTSYIAPNHNPVTHQCSIPNPNPSPAQYPNLSSSLRSSPQSYLAPVQVPTSPSVPPTAPSQFPVVSFSSPDIRLCPSQAQCSEDPCPDLECAICFSQFNNVFRCPKMLQCKHTFCLECLARINVKSAQPSAIQCPLCRGLTPLPDLGLPKLATDSDVLSYLPAAMQRVYSIRFNRSNGKLQVKRRWGQRSLTSLRSVSHSLDVGLPSPPLRGSGGNRGEERGMGGALFRLTGRPACQAFLLTLVVMMMVLLTGIVIFLLTFKHNGA